MAISWDGRESAHCTSATTSTIAPDNALLSMFFSLPTNVVNAAERNAELKEALHARAESTPGATPELQVGERVWAKWWVDRARPNGWYRATATVKRTSPCGVTVEWVGRKGTETTMSWQQARNMLVRAGRLAPHTPHMPQLSGHALVGRRVKIYWPGDDRMYSARVCEYDEVKGCHRMLYDDGDDLWEWLGSVLSPEYVVMKE